MTRKTDDSIRYKDNNMGLKVAVLYDEHANRIAGISRKFDARIDDTDHAAFYCEKCDREVRVVELRIYKEAKEKHKLELIYTLWFELLCEGCGASDNKKMYVNSQLLGGVNWH
ncbi:MAG TPA: hypothetical protein VNK44_04120 [Candidatus Nitrosotenuis sp.]|nr:hypothetical protein [Candidatus Nitrosotenuis sp.]